MLRLDNLLWRALLAGALALVVVCSASAQPLTLDDAISRALNYAPAADIAAAERNLAKAKIEEARAPLFPSVAANGEYNQAPGYDPVVTNRGLTLAQLALDYTAFDGGRRTYQLEAARYAAEAAQLGVDVARQQIVYDTNVAYFDLVRENETAAQLQNSVRRLAQYLAIVENLRRSGRVNASDVLSIRVLRDASESAAAAAQQARAHSSLVLGALIGDPERDNLEVAGLAGLPPEPSGDVAQSPAFEAVQRQLTATSRQIEAAKAERYPALKLTLTSGFEGIDPPNTFDHRLGASYDGAISVPIFDGGLIRSHIDQAMANHDLVQAQLRATGISMRNQLADAISRYRSARHQLDLLARSRATAHDAFALDWTRFLGGGNITLLEVTNAYQQEQSLQTAESDTTFNARQAAAQANLVLGR